jgi:hypothetical protein
LEQTFLLWQRLILGWLRRHFSPNSSGVAVCVVAGTAAVFVLAGALGNGRAAGEGGDFVAQGACDRRLQSLDELLGPPCRVL